MTVSDAAGCKALEHLDTALADKPKKNSHELSAALRCLAEFRDAITALRRKEPAGSWSGPLEKLNAVISSVLAAQFPLGEIPWEEMGKARGWLAELLDQLPSTVTASQPKL